MSDQGLGLSVTQQTLRDVFVDLFEKHSALDRVRATEVMGFDAEMWQRLVDMGVLTTAASADPEERALMTDLVLIAEQRGRRLAPVPLVEAVVAARLEASLTGAPSETWSTLGLRPPVRSTSWFVPWATAASSMICWDGSSVIWSPAVSSSERADGASNLGSMLLGHVELAEGARVLAAGHDAQRARSRMLADWKVLTAASLIGLGNEALEMTVRYVMERSAFGTLIGSFQSVAHRLADHVVALDGARLLTFEAASQIDQDAADAIPLAAAAYVNAAKVAEETTVDGLHFHGGMGYTREYDIQMYFRRAKAWPLVLGDPRDEYRFLGDCLLSGRLGLSTTDHQDVLSERR